MLFFSEVYVLTSVKVQAGNVLISHQKPRLMLKPRLMFFGIRLYCALFSALKLFKFGEYG